MSFKKQHSGFLANATTHLYTAITIMLVVGIFGVSFPQSAAAQLQLGAGETIQSDDLAHRYEAFSPLATGPVTFQQIYDDPENQDLNLAYARQQAASGDLLGAAASLERMLYHNANWDTARLFYAVILYDLDDRKAAAREFGLLEGRPLPPRQSRMASRYRRALDGELSGRPRAVRRGAIGNGPYGRVALNVRHDSNAGGVFGDVVFGNRNESDEAAGLSISAGYRAPLADSESVTAFVGGDLQMLRHEDVSAADYDVITLKAGLASDAQTAQWRTVVEARQINISQTDYLSEIGISGHYGLKLSPTLTVSAHAGLYDRNYEALRAAPNADQRSGELSEVGIGVDLDPSERWQLSARVTYQTSDAQTDAFSYEGPRFAARTRYELSADAYATGAVIIRDLNYDAPSPQLNLASNLEENYVRVRAAVGVKASSLISGDTAAAALLDRTVIEGAVEYSERETNVPGRDFDSTGFELRLIYDF